MLKLIWEIFLGMCLAIGVSMFLLWCLDNDKKALENKPKIETQSIIGEGIVIVEDCEYFRIKTYRGYDIFLHKGNCKNLIHYCKCSK